MNELNVGEIGDDEFKLIIAFRIDGKLYSRAIQWPIKSFLDNMDQVRRMTDQLLAGTEVTIAKKQGHINWPFKKDGTLAEGYSREG